MPLCFLRSEKSGPLISVLHLADEVSLPQLLDSCDSPIFCLLYCCDHIARYQLLLCYWDSGKKTVTLLFPHGGSISTQKTLPRLDIHNGGLRRSIKVVLYVSDGINPPWLNSLCTYSTYVYFWTGHICTFLLQNNSTFRKLIEFM